MSNQDLEAYSQLLTGIHELDIKIINELTDKDLLRFCQINVYAGGLCQDGYLWRQRIISRYGKVKEKPENLTWREFYFVYPYYPVTYESMLQAGKNNDFIALRIIMTQWGDLKGGKLGIITDAARTGNIALLDWLEREKLLPKDLESIALIAKYNKQTKVLDWLVKRGFYPN